MTDVTPKEVDLDAIEDEAGVKEPIQFTLKVGRTVKKFRPLAIIDIDIEKLAHAVSAESENDYKDLLDVIKLIFPEEKYEELKATGKLTFKRAAHMVAEYLKHYDMVPADLGDSSDSAQSTSES